MVKRGKKEIGEAKKRIAVAKKALKHAQSVAKLSMKAAKKDAKKAAKKGKISFSAQTKLKDVTEKNTRYVTDTSKRFKSVSAIEQDYIRDYTRTIRRGNKLISQGK